MQTSHLERCDINTSEILFSHAHANGLDAETVGGETGWRLERRLGDNHELVLLAESIMRQEQDLKDDSSQDERGSPIMRGYINTDS